MLGSVTRRISDIKQPVGGFIRVKQFTITQLEDGKVLNENENVNPGLVGMAVDYLTRYLMGASRERAFEISLMGANVIKDDSYAEKLLTRIKGLDKRSIDAACKLAGYDVCYRAGAEFYKPVKLIKPDDATCQNIKIIVKRCLSFWNAYGPLVLDGFDLEGAYTAFIIAGDGDYLTKDTLWDFKVSRNEPKIKYPLQLLIYYLMGRESVHKEFSTIDKLGLYNPRLNKTYVINVHDIPQTVIDDVSRDVIGYGLSLEETKERIETFFQKTVVIEDGTSVIAKRKYLYCSLMENVLIPDSIKNIDEEAFYGCRRLKTVYYKGTASDWERIKIATKNRELFRTTVLFYTEPKPEEGGKYWHYDSEGKPIAW